MRDFFCIIYIKREEFKLLQFLVLLLVILIFSIIALLSLSFHYQISFLYDQKLQYSFSGSVLFLTISAEKNAEATLLLLKILSFKKEFKLNNFTVEANTVGNFIKNKTTDFIKEKFEKDEVVEEEKIKIEKKKKKKSKFNFPLRLINKENLTHLFKFLVELIRTLRPDYLKLNLLFSFADPYYNGLFLAYYYTFKSLFDYPELKAAINWQEVMFKGNGSLGGSIRPIIIIWQFLVFLFSAKTLRFLWQLYKSK